MPITQAQLDDYLARAGSINSVDLKQVLIDYCPEVEIPAEGPDVEILYVLTPIGIEVTVHEKVIVITPEG